MTGSGFRQESVDFGDVIERVENIFSSLFLSLPNVIIGIVVFLIFWALSWVVAKLVGLAMQRAGRPRGLQMVLSRLTAWSILTFGLLVALTVIFPTITPASLFGALGVGGVVIGFAFRDIFQNLLAGILILFTRPFRIGDQIVSENHEGEVVDILVRATLLRTYDNRVVVIPNSELYTKRVVVNTAYENRRLSVEVGIGYDESIADARAAILEAIATLPGIVTDPTPEVLVNLLGDFSVILEVRFWISPPDRREAVEAQDQVLEAIKRALTAAGIEMPFPIQKIMLDPRDPRSEDSL
ncbi:mechanosensitive ion channel family protein [Salinibacterium sp. UTAS2018]|uniref:mechanosensitive ion channel family protein n=1 Tax=Salinibacterium sp. UTAS2018 TaxID=2508880 RepID=UPI00100967E8|nr:mechanosensitive ion channel family protein [Salinibacterium sp. UTAS2018]QAV70975.1 mechanosensitive ion channel family protein [Salinibacterium sp. UTAS2018]